MRFRRPRVRYSDTPQPVTPYQAAAQAWDLRMGSSLAQLRLHHARRLVGRRTLVLLISDGLDTGAPEVEAQQVHGQDQIGGNALGGIKKPRLAVEYQPLEQQAVQCHRRRAEHARAAQAISPA